MIPVVPVPSGDSLPAVATPLPGARSRDLCDLLASVECPALTMRRARRAESSGAASDPIVWAAARGTNVADVDGNVFVDLTSGFGAALIGYGHPAVLAAIRTQSERLIHALGDVQPSESKIALERRLAALAPWPDARVILGQSGSDAVEAALKTAWLHTKKPRVIAFDGGYHGLSLGAVAIAGYRTSFRAPFADQLNPHVTWVPFPVDGAADCRAAVEAVEREMKAGDVAAIVVEPVLGRGGVWRADIGAMNAIVAAAHRGGAVVIADEIQCGLRRAALESWTCSGAWWNEQPDIVCLGKALGGTLPISACLIRENVARAWGAPDHEVIHTSTFLGNPLACSAALATLDVLESSALLARFADCARGLRADAVDPLLRDERAGVRAIGGAGLMLGIHLAGAPGRALRVVRTLLARGYIALPAGRATDCVALTPSGTLSDTQIAHLAQTLRDALHDTN